MRHRLRLLLVRRHKLQRGVPAGGPRERNVRLLLRRPHPVPGLPVLSLRSGLLRRQRLREGQERGRDLHRRGHRPVRRAGVLHGQSRGSAEHRNLQAARSWRRVPRGQRMPGDAVLPTGDLRRSPRRGRAVWRCGDRLPDVDDVRCEQQHLRPGRQARCGVSSGPGLPAIRRAPTAGSASVRRTARAPPPRTPVAAASRRAAPWPAAATGDLDLRRLRALTTRRGARRHRVCSGRPLP